MNWELYKRRLLFPGETRRARNINSIKRNIENKIIDSPAYKTVVVNDKYNVALSFFSTDYPDEKRFSTIYDGDVVNIGDIIFWNNLHWLVTEIDFDDDIKRGGKMIQCNREISWQNPDTKQIITRWCLATKPYSSNLRDGFIVDTSKREYKIQVPYDSETILIDLDKRFLLETINNTPKAYRVTSVDVNTNKYQDIDGGFIVWNLTQDQYNSATDNQELMIADYVPEGEYTSSDQSGSICHITGPDTIYYPSKAVVYTIEYTVDGEPADFVDFEYRISGIDASYYTCLRDGNQICLEITNRKCVGKTAVIEVIPLADGYPAATKRVKVGALL